MAGRPLLQCYKYSNIVGFDSKRLSHVARLVVVDQTVTEHNIPSNVSDLWYLCNEIKVSPYAVRETYSMYV